MTSSNTDDDWFSDELELNPDLQDVLLGPIHATKDDVSNPIEASQILQSLCDICGDSHTTMRELKVCYHQICEGCLEAQLGAQHECRYKCPLCRAEFFPPYQK